MTKRISGAITLLGSVLVAACGHDMTGPGMNGYGGDRIAGAAFLSVSPEGGASGVAVDSPITLRFSGTMGTGMERYLDLHVGDLSGPTVAMGCSWSADRTLLTCLPTSPLAPHTTYAVHLGGGMTSANGSPLDYTTNGPRMGGRWIMGGMMSGSHAGAGWGTMGGGWRNANGSYGMVFTFTTA